MCLVGVGSQLDKICEMFIISMIAIVPRRCGYFEYIVFDLVSQMTRLSFYFSVVI